jgi:tetraacyldisaccharide 4'-kinase
MLSAHPEVDVVLCDDGLQHYALARDVEIAVIDAARGLGNGWLLPAGPLREPRARLDEVDAIVFNGTGTVVCGSPRAPQFSMRLMGALAVHVHDPTRTLRLTESRPQRLAAIAGIGNPARFFAHLRALGLSFEAHPFPDHHAFEMADLQRIQADCVLMTEKDAIKCARLPDDRLWMVPVEAKVDAALVDLIVARIGR